MIQRALLILFLLGTAAASANTHRALPRQGGELGNGRSVSYPIIGIRTVRPDAWGDFESFGNVRIFRPVSDAAQGEAVVIFESVARDAIHTVDELADFTRTRFAPRPATTEITLTQSDKLHFAFLLQESSGLKGCAWKSSTKSHLCFTAQTPRGHQEAIRMILQNLEIIE